jgi:hypothetical protein
MKKGFILHKEELLAILTHLLLVPHTLSSQQKHLFSGLKLLLFMLN